MTKKSPHVQYSCSLFQHFPPSDTRIEPRQVMSANAPSLRYIPSPYMTHSWVYLRIQSPMIT